MADRVRDLLTCAQMLMHEIAHEGCPDTVRESTLLPDCEKNLLRHRRLDPASVLRLGLSVGRSII